MTRSTRFPAHAGTIPAGGSQTRRRFARRFLVAVVGLMSALIAVSSYAGRGSQEAPTPIVGPAQKVALATTEPTKRRSFTRNDTREVTRIAEPASPQATALTILDQVTFSDPVTTGAVSISAAAQETPRRAGAPDRLTQSERPTQLQARVSRHQSGAERRDGVKRLREARRSVTVNRVAKRATSPARSAGLAHRRQGHLASRPNPERVVSAAPPQGVSPCLLFVGCF